MMRIVQQDGWASAPFHNTDHSYLMDGVRLIQVCEVFIKDHLTNQSSGTSAHKSTPFLSA
jgi:hypothetical protein